MRPRGYDLFDRGQAEELGRRVVKFGAGIIKLINALKQVNGFPGMRVGAMNEKTFMFKATDYAKYLRQEACELRGLLFAYKIKI